MIKKIIYISLIVIGIFGIINTIFVMQISSGFNLGAILPSMIGICLIVFSVLKLRLKDRKIIKNKTFRRIVIVVFLICFVTFVGIEALIITNGNYDNSKAEEADYLIVLGCGIFRDGTLTLTLQRRLNVAHDYLNKYPDAMCIVSGGQGVFEPISEAEAMYGYLVDKGIDPCRIIKEDKSTSTSENLLFSKKLMDIENPTIAIATSDFHIFRAKFLAKRYGYGNAVGLTCETAWYIRLNTYLRESIAVVKSFLLD